MKRKLFSALLAVALALTGCAQGGQSAETGQEDPAQSPESAPEETAEETAEDPRNQDSIGERELLVISFGTSYPEPRRLDIGGIEDALDEAFPEWSVRRAFTSQTILDKLKDRDGLAMDNVQLALDRAKANGVESLVVQPTHLMDGLEYYEMLFSVADYAGDFPKLAVGRPLLSSDEDFDAVAEAVAAVTAEYRDGETAVCLMGHGTEADSNQIYGKMQGVFTEKGLSEYFVGTVEAEPSLDDVLSAVKAGNYRRVVLLPMMIVAGDHALNDMAGDDDDSWKNVFTAAGYETLCLLRGLGELEPIQAIFVSHAQAAMDNLAPEETAPAASLDLADGAYTVEVGLDGGSGRAGVESPAPLTVQDGAGTLRLTWSSPNYDYMKVNGERYLPVNTEGNSVFEIPVAALDMPLEVIADTTAMGQPHEITYSLAFGEVTPAP